MMEPIEKITEFVLPLLDGTDMFIVKMIIKPTNNVKLYLDADTGLSIQNCTEINRKLYHMILESGMFPDDDFSLEVSSPGVDEPLVNNRQFQKNKGRTLMVTDMEGKVVTGKLTEVTEETLILEVPVPKSKNTVATEIGRAQIKAAIVQVSFK